MIHRSLLACALVASALAIPATAHASTAAKLPCRGFCEQPATALTAETRTLKAGDVTIAYRIFGKGRTLVLISGFAQGMDQWDPAFLDALARQHRLVVFDGQGIGRSTATDGELTVAGLTGDAARLITALKLKRPDILGWSLGGMVAQELAIERPDLVRRIVLAATSGGTPSSPGPTAEALALATNPGATVKDRLGLLFPAAHNNASQSYFARILERASLSTPGTTVIARQLSAMTAWLASPDAALKRLGKVGRRARVLVADGAKDSVLPAAGTRLLGKAIPGSTVVVYPKSGHGFLFQDRDRFVLRVLRFLR